MSVEQVKAFFAKANEDEALAQQLKDAQAAYTGDKSDKDAAFAEIFIPIAAAEGFNFTVEDFMAVFDNNEDGESSAEELKAVAGGVRRNDLRNTTNVVVNC
ncbi:MAG: Nif11-like leader peptide family natural product precursor [Selenomonadaceae bacterium]|nr:Nif11-like leader peptide family natural product precursor [Selenomonadaceae bacterium]